MKSSEQLSEKRHQALAKLLKDNELLAALYPIVDLLRAIWGCKRPEHCKELIEHARKLLFAASSLSNNLSPCSGEEWQGYCTLVNSVIVPGS